MRQEMSVDDTIKPCNPESVETRHTKGYTLASPPRSDLSRVSPEASQAFSGPSRRSRVLNLCVANSILTLEAACLIGKEL